MNTIHVPASREYDVRVERGCLDGIGDAVARLLPSRTAAVISDDNVFPLYGARVCASLERAGFRVVHNVIPHGERNKNLDTYGRVLEFLSASRLTRSDVLVALGGGMVGDLAGFAAASYQRGIAFLQVPTTLLAMVDSSVGGKTAVDLAHGKNQVGSFHQPSLVLCDPETLRSLPEEEYRCGCAEVIKYGALGSAEFFETLKKRHVREQEEQVIAACVTMKRDIVGRDEFDLGERRLLNLGHTFGHAVEAASNFTLLHGQAVAIGMAVMARAAAARGFCDAAVPREMEKILAMYGLPDRTDYPVPVLYEAAMADKKMTGGTMNLVVPERIGACRVVKIPAEEMKDWMYSGGLV